jgi:site-specific DNA recombinase
MTLEGDIFNLTRSLHHLFAHFNGRYATGNYSLLEVTKKAQAERLNYRKTGAKLHKNIVHKILTNPIYYGDFDWAGRRYRGNHKPIVSK